MAAALIRLARDFRGLSQAKLAAASGLSSGHLSRLEVGSADASAEDLTAIGAALGFPAHFFLSDCRLLGSVGEVHFRRKAATLAGARRRAIAMLNLAEYVFGATADLVGLPEPELSLEERSVDEFPGGAAHAAHCLRLEWGVPPGPIQNLTQVVEDAGIAVFDVALGEDVCGLSMWVEGHQPTILLNASMPGDRKRITLAHELGHLYLHSFRRDASTMEDEATAFGASFLAPRDDIFHDLRGLTVAKLRRLKSEWGISMQALIMHASRLGQLSEYEKTGWFKTFSKRGWRKSEPEEFPSECVALVPALLTKAAEIFGSRQSLADGLDLPEDVLLDLWPNASAPESRIRLVEGGADSSRRFRAL